MNQKGFSLLELIIYVAILSALTMVTANIFITINRGGGQNEARAEVNSALRFSMEKIASDLRSATSTSTILNPASTTTPKNFLEISVGGNNIKYATTTDNFLKREFNSSPENLTSDRVSITKLTFTRLENKNIFLDKTFISIQIEIGAKYNSDSPDWQYNENKKTTVSLR
jgi:prepilin-type N-terminal cleavage/methylation domain-containing protein